MAQKGKTEREDSGVIKYTIAIALRLSWPWKRLSRRLIDELFS
jgi:hypothetical protein